MSSVFLCLLLISIVYFLSTPTSSTTITLSLSQIPCSNSLEFTSHLAKSSLFRARHLKNPKNIHSLLHGSSSTPLYPRSYGGYTVSLAFGTPPQPIPLVFDTGSSLLWVPCTFNYSCLNCTFSHVDPKNISTFIPKLSTSSRVVRCKNEKCGLFYGPDMGFRCPNCGPDLGNCSSPCPDYLLQYGLGATTGTLISENLDLPRGVVVRDFLLGCSVLSIQQPEGISGFGRAPTSVPNQLKLKMFSYCLVSHTFDDSPKSSELVLAGAGKFSTHEVIRGVKYTPFYKNPNVSPYDEYYYIYLTKITVGKRQAKVKIPFEFLAPDSNGTGGTIVDSGSTLTYMESPIYESLVKEFMSQLGHVKRAHESEVDSGFGLCLDVLSVGNVSIPELAFHFRGGVKMKLPLANYLKFFPDLGALCLTIITDGPGKPSGPSVIIGNYVQQNFYIEYDLEHQRMGFKKQKCG